MSRSRRVGTSWESAIVKALQDTHWPHAERRALQGSKDRGDVAGVIAVMIEAKSAQQVRLHEWWRETLIEKDNDNAEIGALWIKVKGRASALDGMVVISGEDFIHLLHNAGY